MIAALSANYLVALLLPLIPALGDLTDDLRELGLSTLAAGARLQLDRPDTERSLLLV
jgi:hypothetical protein